MTRALSLAAALLALGACAAPPPDAGGAMDRLRNGSFEKGRAPWFDFQSPRKPFWGGFEITAEQALEGEHCLRLSLDSLEFPGPIGIAGAAQDVEMPRLPSRVAGHYRVEYWERGTPAQYIQVVVMAMQRPSEGQRILSRQVAWVLAGVDTPPVEIANRVFLFAGPTEPETGRWIPFDLDVAAAFAEHWPGAEKDLMGVRVFLEARFDGFEPRGGRRAVALTYFDAIHVLD